MENHIGLTRNQTQNFHCSMIYILTKITTFSYALFVKRHVSKWIFQRIFLHMLEPSFLILYSLNVTIMDGDYSFKLNPKLLTSSYQVFPLGFYECCPARTRWALGL